MKEKNGFLRGININSMETDKKEIDVSGFGFINTFQKKEPMSEYLFAKTTCNHKKSVNKTSNK